MNWKEAPHLFANGKFEIKIHYGKDDLRAMDFNHLNLGDTVHYPDHCTLIARPISDMSDEEKAEWKHFIYDQNAPKGMISRYANQTAWLLSIGVYPFDQAHFNDGSVIARYENTEGE